MTLRCLPGNLARPVEPVREHAVEDVVDERGLARAADARDGREGAEREVDIDAAQVVRLSALHRDHALGVDRARRCAGVGISLRPDEVVAGERTRVLHEVGVAAGVHHGAAVHAGARTDVDDPVGGADRVFVVLDDDERVAEVAEGDERVDEAPVVALVQPDARLVEHVEHAGEARTDLRRESDALRLSAGEGPGSPREVEVAESHADEEVEPQLDLAQHLCGDRLLAVGELRAGP